MTRHDITINSIKQFLPPPFPISCWLQPKVF